jgi:hypothetical protein
MTGLVTPRCSAHSVRPAGWRCAACRRALCPGCVVEVEVHLTAYVRCAACGGRVDVLTRPGSDVSFFQALRGVLLLPVGLPGLFVLLLLALVSSELDVLLSPGREFALLCWSAVAWLVGVAVVHATADGATTLRGVPVHTGELLRPALLATVLTAPALLLPRTGLAAAALVVASVPLLVPVLLCLLAQKPLREALSPRTLTRVASRLGADGLLLMASVAVVWLFARALGALAESPPSDVPALWRMTLGLLGALSLFLVPRFLGLLLEARGEVVDYPFRSRGRVPLLPGARAEAYRAPETAPRAPREAIPLEGKAQVLELEPLSPTREEDE